MSAIQAGKSKQFSGQEDGDEEAAAVVRMIYQKTIEGKGPYTIARELSEAKIERPSYYLGKKGLGNHSTDYDKTHPYSWNGGQIAYMIARPEYIGKTVNFRTYKNSYKDKRPKNSDPEDWVVFDGTQEPIVDTETWKLAQKLRGTVRKIDSMGEPNVLTGLVYCADCGAPMYNHRHRNNRVRTYYIANGERRQRIAKPEDYYCCSTYNLFNGISFMKPKTKTAVTIISQKGKPPFPPPEPFFSSSSAESLKKSNWSSSFFLFLFLLSFCSLI